MRKHASEITYDECSFLGIPALLTDWRISRSTVPDGVHAYELRHADGNPFDPCQAARGILVNFCGSILTLQPLPIPEDGYLNFDGALLSAAPAAASPLGNLCGSTAKGGRKHA